MVILEFVLNELNDKIMNSAHLLPLNQEQNVKVGWGGSYSELQITFFRERRTSFSLNSRAIGPSNSFRTRRKAVLHEADNAWTLVLGVFDKLREVGVSSYLGFTFCLSVFTMFELDEAVRGRLIGSKA